MTSAARNRLALARTLAARTIGELVFFVLLDDVEDGYPPLLVQPVERDPTGARLVNLVAAMPGTGADFVHGVGYIGEDGTPCLRGAELDRGWYEQLAGWLERHVDATPELGVLLDFRMERVHDGVVVASYGLDGARDPRTRRPRRQGGLRAQATVLRALEPGATARFWLADEAGVPALVVVPRAGDEAGAAFTRAVAHARTRGVDPGRTAAAGLVRRGLDGRLSFLVDGDPETLAERLHTLAERRGRWAPALWELLGARVLRLHGDRPVAAPAAGPTLRNLQKALRALRASGGEAVAWFTPRSRSGRPQLVLAKSPERLEALVADRRSGGPELVGTLNFAGDAPTLTRKAGSAALLEHLAGYVAAWRHVAPALEQLRGLALDGRPSPAVWWQPLEVSRG